MSPAHRSTPSSSSSSSSVSAPRAAVLAVVAVAAALSGCRGRAPAGPPPTEVVVARELAAAYFAEERYDEARAAMEDVLDSRWATARDFVNAACVDIAQPFFEAAPREEAWARAERRLDEALERDDALAEAWYCRGVLAHRNVRFEDAARCFREALLRAPGDPAAHLQLAVALTDLDRRDEAEVELRAVLARGVEYGGSFYVSALHRLAQFLLRSGEPEKIAEANALAAEKAQLEEGGIKAPSLEELDRGILGRVTIPEPVANPGVPVATIPSFEVVPLDVFRGIGAVRDVVAWDLDEDGDEDLVASGDGGVAVGDQGEGRRYSEERLADGAWRRAIPTDLDDDGRASLLLLGDDGTALFTRVEDAWRDDTATLPEGARGRLEDALFVDFEHEGDLDLLVATGEGLRLFRNRGAARHPEPVLFEDATGSANMPEGPFTWLLLLDHDDDQDVDFLTGGPTAPTLLLSNLRQGRFEVKDGAATGLPAAAAAARRGDLDHDGRPDLVFAGEPATAWRNRGDGTFEGFEGSASLALSWAGGPAALVDVDRNGELDLLRGARIGGPPSIALGSLLRDPGQELELPGRVPAEGPLLAQDLDGDGDVDLLLLDEDGRLGLQRQSGPPPEDVLRLSLSGRKDNRPAVGAIVEMRAGPLYTRHFVERPNLRLGLGGATHPDVVRVTWPNGVVQYAIRPPAGEPIAMVQKEGLSGSCPFLYAWDGEGWTFLGDVLGATPLGLPMAPGVHVPPNHEELVRVPGDRLAPKDGVYELAITEELRETTYLDRAELWVVDHAPDVEVHPEERFCFPPFPAKTVHALKDVFPVVKAIGSDGRDWTDVLARQDAEHAVPFEALAPQFQGLATPHWLELTLPDAARDAPRVRLLMTGWFYWTDASVNVAAAQHETVEFVPPMLSVPDGAGGWRETGPSIGFPTGKTKTMVFDVADRLNRDDLRIRISSTLRLYWDCIRVATDDGDHPLSITRIDADGAILRHRGFSQKLPRAREQDPEWFAYDRTMPAPWNQHRGLLTRYGDVLPLLEAVDDRFVLFSAGDEVLLRFPAGDTARTAGAGRTYLLFLDGWAKDDDPNSTYGGQVEPLPFHGMSGYPYGEDEAYPDDALHRAYRDEWNTRPGRRLIESLADPSAADRRNE